MNKPTKKRVKYNTEVVEALSLEYGVSTRFVRLAIRKEKESLTADTIRTKYYQLVNPTKKAVEEFKKNPVNQ